MFKVEVIADNSGQWCGNGLTFETEEKANEYGRDLSWRWTAVRKYRVVPVTPAPPVVEHHERCQSHLDDPCDCANLRLGDDLLKTIRSQKGVR